MKKNQPDEYQRFYSSMFGFNLIKYLINVDEQQDHEKIQRWKKGIRRFLKFLVIFALVFAVFALFYFYTFRFLHPVDLPPRIIH